jgi:hypothetical protein
MNVCGVTRLLVPASFAWLVVSTISGRDAYGLIAALLTAGVLYAIGRVHNPNRVCAMPGARGSATDTGPSVDLTASGPKKGPE